MARRIGAGVSVLIATLFSYVALHSQSTPPASQNPPSQQKPGPALETATVLKTVTRMVVIDVVATDHKNKPVTDLKAGDFTVLENGKEQQIKVFSFQHPTPGDPTMTVRAETDAPPNLFTNVPRYSVNTALNVILLDGLNTTMPNQSYVRQQMLKYLEKLPEGQPVSVYTLSTHLRLLQDFTTDPEVLKEAVKKLKGTASPLLDNPAGGPDESLQPNGSFDGGSLAPSLSDSLSRFESERTSFQTDLRVKYTLAALSSLAHSLAGYPGRKNLIWISESFPINIDPDFTLGGDAFSSSRNYSEEIASTADSLIDSQVAVYPIDARGLAAYSYFSAANSGISNRGGNGRAGNMARNGPNMAAALSRESANLQAVHGTMQDLAYKTGGKAFYNRNDIDGAIRNSIDDGSTYYTLAYYPDNKDWNGKFRKIQVKVNRDGVALRHRDGYYAVNPVVLAARVQKEKHDDSAFGRALSLDYPVATALLFRAGVLSPSEQTQNKVMVNFAIDPHAISFDSQNDGLQHAEVECVVQVFSQKGKPVKSEGAKVTASLKPETFNKLMKDNVFPCQKSFDLPAGSYLLRLGVRDDRSGLVGSTNANVTVAAAAGSGDK